MNQLKLASLAVSLGTVDTLVEHPASMTHAEMKREMREKMGITDGLVRVSVGIEDQEDILADFSQGLDKLADN
jgi:methionine-gamma-lyase